MFSTDAKERACFPSYFEARAPRSLRYWGKKRLKIPLLFLTSETLDFESEHVFESHEDLQRSTNMMLALTSFSMDQIGPNMGQIGPKQPILEVETQD